MIRNYGTRRYNSAFAPFYTWCLFNGDDPFMYFLSIEYIYGTSRADRYSTSICMADRYSTSDDAAGSSDNRGSTGRTGRDDRGSRRGGGRRPVVPEAPKEELAKVLTVKEVDLHIESNAIAHRTDKYECTEHRKDEAGKPLPPELVVRRGQFFDVTLKFSREYKPEKDDMRLSFSYGDDPQASRGTYTEFKVDETKKRKFKPEEWGATLKSIDGFSMTFSVHVPATVSVGIWDMDVQSICEGKNKEGKDVVIKYTYQHDTDVTILFNPWCKEDGVFMATEKLLDEYVLNENGLVHQGSYWNIGAKPWEFGQFDDEALKAALYVMNQGFLKSDSMGKADPIRVVRRIALTINASVLTGNWSGDYKDGVEPWRWNGSVPILQKFMEAKESVKYGQCWVFSCLTTTVCRALGIPCRSVTNFASAHDTEESCTIDTFYDPEGEDVSSCFTGDSVWNFHVWNEAWMARPDLRDLKGMDGWQVIDATPQEETIGPGEIISGYTCGPCPVRTIKLGNCRTNYDAGFIYGEVNADRVTWQIEPDGRMTVMDIETASVGKNISTKKPDGKTYPPEDFDPETDRTDMRRDIVAETRLDLTHEYKCPEGSEEERYASVLAHETARNAQAGLYEAPSYQKDVTFKLREGKGVMIGSDIPITCNATNNSKEDVVIEQIIFRVGPKSYTGMLGKAFFKQKFYNIRLPAGQEFSCNLSVTKSEYWPYIAVEMGTFYIEAFAVVVPTGNQPVQRTHMSRDFYFKMPSLTVKGPKEAKEGDTVEYEVSFTNPLDVTLKQGSIAGESSTFRRWIKKEIGDIPAKGTVKETFQFKVKKRLRQHQVIFELETAEFQNILGEVNITVTA